jgi:short-subunit dehydrogenase
MGSNKYLLISAATSDIGKAIVQKLSQEYNLVLHGRNREKLNDIVKNTYSKNAIKTWRFDLQEVAGIQLSLKSFLLDSQIEISGFIHCAGTLRILPIKNFRLDYCKEIFDVNFFSAVEIIKTLLFKKNNGSLNNIVMISSLASKKGDKNNSIYSASKGAIDSFVKSIAIELAPRVRVNSVLPSLIKTQISSHLFQNETQTNEYLRLHPLGEGNCLDVANLVSFLLSNDSKWITGQNYIIDGGRSLV